jgi:hypothetical protein
MKNANFFISMEEEEEIGFNLENSTKCWNQQVWKTCPCCEYSAWKRVARCSHLFLEEAGWEVDQVYCVILQDFGKDFMYECK